MKEFFKKRLRELLKENWEGNRMKPVWDSEITEQGKYHNTLIIAEDIDNPTEHYLILNVKLLPNTSHYDYSYGFSIFDTNLKKSYGYLYTRAEVSKWLPNELRGKIMPKVHEMTKDLVIKNKPKILYRQAMEDIEGNSLKRYDKITKLFIDLGYKLQEGYPRKNNMNKWEWLFTAGNTEMKLDEVTMFKNDIVDGDMRRARFEKFLDENLTPEAVLRTINNRTK
jgi:hypothetical protein